MKRKTLILTENQFNEICGTNTAYLDNSNSYAEDGLTTTKTGGAVSDSNGEKEYSEPLTTDDYAHELAPETLFALLFRNGGHGLWGHWGSGLRVRELTEENTGTKNINLDDMQEPLYDYDLFENGDANYYFTTEEPLQNNAATLEKFFERYVEQTTRKIKWDFDWSYGGGQAFGTRDDGMEIQVDAGGNGNFMSHLVTVTCIKKKLQESNSELEKRSWRLDLDNDGLKKTYSYTNLTTKKTELKQLLTRLVQQNAPKQQIERVKRALGGICSILNRETGAIKQRKTTRKNLGYTNQFQKEGGTKNPKNGQAHSKKIIKDPNIGEGFITYA